MSTNWRKNTIFSCQWLENEYANQSRDLVLFTYKNCSFQRHKISYFCNPIIRSIADRFFCEIWWNRIQKKYCSRLTVILFFYRDIKRYLILGFFILCISSYSNINVIWAAKIGLITQLKNPPNWMSIHKFHQLIPQFYFIIFF